MAGGSPWLEPAGAGMKGVESPSPPPIARHIYILSLCLTTDVTGGIHNTTLSSFSSLQQHSAPPNNN